jgi:bifunctional DNase/RNase
MSVTSPPVCDVVTQRSIFGGDQVCAAEPYQRPAAISASIGGASLGVLSPVFGSSYTPFCRPERPKVAGFRDPILGRPPSEEQHVQEMVIYGVSFDMVGKQPIVLLKTVENNKFLPIWIGHPEAAAILMKLQGASTPRPMTHDLLSDMLGELEVECTRVAVTELRENTFYASISLRANGREIEIDSRPSDALALAVRAGAPIFAADEVISESAIEFEHEVEDTEEVVEKFKDFLDRVSPEDFASEE